ncbi:MAG: TylF/MycF/NovP-related O-methyltransferase [Pseudomonadota bacterium]
MAEGSLGRALGAVGLKGAALGLVRSFGYEVVKRPELERLMAAPEPAPEPAPDPEPRPEPEPDNPTELEDYQLQEAKHHLDVGTKDFDPAFFPLYERCKPYTMTSPERLYGLYKATRFVVEAEIPGDIVECGVWKGGSMMMMALTLLSLGADDRRLVLFDTYEGLPEPDKEKDINIWGGSAHEGWSQHRISETSSTWARSPLDEVQANMASTGYPEARIDYVVGMVEETIPGQAPDEIALLRLDTDWYASTKHEMVELYPRLAPSGVLIIDDYGHFEGARQAVDEFLAESGTALLLNRLDYSGRLAQKPG